MDAPTWGVFATFFLTIFKVAVDYVEKGRQREWDIEQREYDRKERLRVAADLKAHTAVTTGVIVGKIAENTAVNEAALVAGEKAYTEANNLSLKIAQQGLELRAPSRQSDHKPEGV